MNTEISIFDSYQVSIILLNVIIIVELLLPRAVNFLLSYLNVLMQVLITALEKDTPED